MQANFNLWGKKPLLGFAVVVIVAGGLVWGWYQFKNWRDNRTISNEFVGDLGGIKGNTILVSGRFYTDKKAFLPQTKDPIEVQVSIDNSTKFHRVTFQIPTAEELKKTNGIFYPDKLPKQEKDVSFDDFVKDASSSHFIFGLDVLAKDNILNASKFTASNITYRFPTLSSK